MRTFLSLSVLILIAGSFTFLQSGGEDKVPVSGQYDRYFATPKNAVEAASKLIESEDWATLATYYDLSSTGLERSNIGTERFFLETEKPDVVHPAGFWRYKQPFAPGFQFESARKLENDIVEVTVMVEIDQGDGTVQRGLDTFKLKAHPEGYQLLPKTE